MDAPYKTNTYVVHVDSLAVKNHVAVREVLRRNPELRDEYSAVKQDLAIKTSDIDVYVSGKTEVLQRVLKLGGLNDEELDEIAGINSK